MHTFINSPLQIGSLTLPHRLIQGPLAGYSCAPFRELFNQFTAPAYCVTEMSSAIDVLQKHTLQSRYLYRSPQEKTLAYQIAGTDAPVLAQAAAYLQSIGANLIDINCGCPKNKIRKKGAGSALLEDPQNLLAIVQQVRQAISIPLTVKIRIQGNTNDIELAQRIENAGADALIIHGRRWYDDYDIACNIKQIASIKSYVGIPVIANGDITDYSSLMHMVNVSGCDGFMIGRSGSGRPWLFQELLEGKTILLNLQEKLQVFMRHLQGLQALENEFKAVLQSKSLVRYYFREVLPVDALNQFYLLGTLDAIHRFLSARFAANS